MRAFTAVALFAAGLLAGFVVHVAPPLRLAHATARTGASANARSPDSASIERRLARVEDHIAIERLLMEYGRTLDTGDFTAFSRLFATNGEWSGNIGTFKGPAAIQAAMDKAFHPRVGAPPVPTFYHVLTNAIIDIHGDRATALSKWTFIGFVHGRPQVGAIGYYDDTLVRENGSWRFLHRKALAMRPVGTSGKAIPSLR